MRDAKAFARQAVEEVARDGFTRGEADRVNETVEALGPGSLEVSEQALDGGVIAHIAVKHQFGIEFGSEFSDAVLEAFADVAESQFGAFAMAGLGDAVGDGAVRKQACDEQALAGEESHAVSGVLWSGAILT